MSFADTHCPCTRAKPPGEMLCDECNSKLNDLPDMRTFRDGAEPVRYRRAAAIRLLALSRRNRPQPVYARSLK